MKHRQPIEWSRRQTYNRVAKAATERLRELELERKLSAHIEREMAALEGDDVPDDMEAK